jgi:hypothetical protein
MNPKRRKIMRKVTLQLALTAIMVVSFLSNASAASIPYFTQTSTNSEFNIFTADPNNYFSFGYYQVPDWQNPDIDAVSMTEIFAAGTAAGSGSSVQINGPLDPSVFGFYMLNAHQDKIWLTDETILGSAIAGDLDGWDVQVGSPERFVTTHVVGNSYSFEMFNGAISTYRLDVSGDDIAPVPEPTTMLLFGTGLIGLAGVARRRKKQ